MDWLTFFAQILTFISNVVSALAWPAFLAFSITHLRPQLAALLPHLRKFKLGNVEVEIAEDLEKGKLIVQSKGDAIPLADSAQLSPEDPFVKLAMEYPELAVLKAFKDVESATYEYNKRFPNAAVHRPHRAIRALQAMRLLDHDTQELWYRVRDVRNKVVHAHAYENHTISGPEAVEYRLLCDALITRIKDAIDRVPEPRDVGRTEIE